MLVVYLNLFGASYLSLAKPLIALFTAITVAGAWFLMYRRCRAIRSAPAACCDR
jgi:threonine/homoserine/homoserine lactone efflux protein